MKKEEVYLDLTNLRKEQLINIAECVKHEIYKTTYLDLSKGISKTDDAYKYLVFICGEWLRTGYTEKRKEITYFEFLGNFSKQLPESITLPIEDYNRLRKLEIKSEIKRLKRELKGL